VPRRNWAASAAFVFAALLAAVPARAADASIFAAASLTDVMQELADGFADETGREVAIVPGASSTLARQIAAGAPADAFVSANRMFADLVAEQTGGRVVELFGNALVIIAPDAFEGEVALGDLEKALGDGRLAIGDPAHVPAGIYAREALVNAGLWELLADRLAPAADVRAAAALVAEQAAPFGIVYRTDAAMEGVRAVGRIDEALHSPIRYYSVVVEPDNVTADMFFSYLGSMKGENLIEYLGFDVGRDFDFLDKDGKAGQGTADGAND